MVLATGGALSWLMDVENAKATLKFVAAKEQTRAAKRKAAAQAAAAVEQARKHEAARGCRLRGQAREGGRPPGEGEAFQVDNLGRFHRS